MHLHIKQLHNMQMHVSERNCVTIQTERTIMKLSYISLALVAAISLPSSLTAQETEGRRLALLAFNSIDSAERGFINQGEFTNFGSNVFYSMDYNDDDKLTLGEFLSWDFGMRELAQDVGREAGYDTAMRVVFSFWDRNGDNEISRTEHRQSVIVDFARADIDNDAIITEEEFTLGFSIMVALRAAINPAPVE